MDKMEVTLLSEVEALELLLHRLPQDHPQRKYMEAEFHRKSAGRRGEERLAHKMREIQLDEEHHYLRNICLAAGDWKVQMDGILLTRRGALIIESKNISGELHFQEGTGEFFRIDSSGVKTVMDDPTVQLNKNIRFLTNFFRLHRIRLPIAGLVVFTSKQCEFISKPRTHTVCKTYQLTDRLFGTLQTFPQNTSRLSISKIIKLFQKHHAPYERIPLCEQYHIDPADLVTGVFCVGCKQHTVISKRTIGWLCSGCQLRGDGAIYLALQEYFSLINRQLSNPQLRAFCNIESRYTASRILASFDLAVTGNGRSRYYELHKYF